MDPKTIQNRLKKIISLLPKAMHQDRMLARRRIRQIRAMIQHDRMPSQWLKTMDRLESRLTASVKIRNWRLEHRPTPAYPEHLPILARKDDIIQAILQHPVIIVSGETGSGKTTQLPKFCLEAGRGIDGMIGCTQPRRIAAVTTAHRIAHEFSEHPGGVVGYKIRFQDQVSPEHSFIKLMTDGILLAEAQGDKYLNEYDTLIIDEAHERTINIDFILGMLRRILEFRKDLKLIVTSATIDTEKFSAAFHHAPIIEVSGRIYPVEVQYTQETDDADMEEISYVDQAVEAVSRIMGSSGSGDILVFMPTEQDIRDTCEILEGRKFKHAVILPLFARLPASDQLKVFSNVLGRKIIVATNVAETSITVPGIRYVVDTGLARILKYDPRTRTTALPVSPISKSSADQRKGRCGRVENGICIRLYSKQDYESRPLYTTPEILRANLAEVILRMIALDLGDIHKFPFIDPPPARQLKDGFDMLMELGAIEISVKSRKEKQRPRLTPLGEMMAKIPLDPRLSRMLLEAANHDCMDVVTVIAAALTIQDPREKPDNDLPAAQEAHFRFQDPASDFITLYNIWRACFGEPDSGKIVRAKDLKKFCKENYLSFKRMREWQDIHEQITEILEEAGINKWEKKTNASKTATGTGALPVKDSGDFSKAYAAIHKSILSGFLSNIAVKKEKNIYLAARQREVMIFPGSGLFNKAGDWIVAAEIVETSRVYARRVANIDSAWLESIGKLHCKYTYSNPRWEKNREAVLADEQVSLYGLIIIPKRTVLFGPIEPEKAADIFIQSALIDRDVKTILPFMRHNWSLMDTIQDMENRLRRRDIRVSDTVIMEFYRSRLGGVWDMAGLKKKIKAHGSDAFLRMSKADLLATAPDDAEISMFPDQITVGDAAYACSYRFDPGHDHDGVTVKLPVSAAKTVVMDAVDWVVPGLLEEKITLLLKGLPKTYRKQLVPLTDTIRVIMAKMPRYKDALATSLSRFIYERFHVDIPASAWREDLLPDYLKTRIAWVDASGKEICAGRDKHILNQSFSQPENTEAMDHERKKWEKTGITRWDVGDLPESIQIHGPNGLIFPVFPAFCKEADGVSLRLFTDRKAALRAHRQGVCRLFGHYFDKDVQFLKKNLRLPADMEKAAVYFGGKERFESQMVNRVMKDLFAQPIRTQDAFLSHAKACMNQILPAGKRLMDIVIPVVRLYADARNRIFAWEQSHGVDPVIQSFLKEIRQSLSRIVPENFLALYSHERMASLGRYIKAILIRAERGMHDPDKDRKKAAKIKPFENALDELVKEITAASSDAKREALESLFWMIEEYKVSVFAQELKTAFPVSPKKIEDKIREIRRMV